MADNFDGIVAPLTWWCVTCKRGSSTLKGHWGHDLTRIGPKATLPPDAGLLPGEKPLKEPPR